MNFMICKLHFNKILKLFWLNSRDRDCDKKKVGVVVLLDKVDFKTKSTVNNRISAQAEKGLSWPGRKDSSNICSNNTASKTATTIRTNQQFTTKVGHISYIFRTDTPGRYNQMDMEGLNGGVRKFELVSTGNTTHILQHMWNGSPTGLYSQACDVSNNPHYIQPIIQPQHNFINNSTSYLKV